MRRRAVAIDFAAILHNMRIGTDATQRVIADRGG
jgi:hypothetical protein